MYILWYRGRYISVHDHSINTLTSTINLVFKNEEKKYFSRNTMSKTISANYMNFYPDTEQSIQEWLAVVREKFHVFASWNLWLGKV